MTDSVEKRYAAATITAPATDLARQWDGWHTALKPSHEPIVVARKPLIGTVAANVERYGVGALNIDGTRIKSAGDHKRPFQPTNNGRNVYGKQAEFHPTNATGRWPANVVLDEEAGRMLNEQTGHLHRAGNKHPARQNGGGSFGGGRIGAEHVYQDSGGPSRFFYCSKASRKERERGLNGDRCVHPTVKPVALMRWLVRLVTPPGGLVLDPFAGSGTTGIACAEEGFRFIGIEREFEYAGIAVKRIAAAQPQLLMEVTV